MPIRFRCGYCNRLLGIARRKAGTETTCPHCGYVVTVPYDPGDAPVDDSIEDDRTELVDLESLLNPTAPPPPATPPLIDGPRTTQPAPVPRSPSSAQAARTVAPPPRAPQSAPDPRPASASPAESRPIDDRPLFERDLDAVLGTPHKANESEVFKKPQPVPTSGLDAMSLGSERGHLVLSARKATALVVAVVVLLALSFAAGFLLASAK